MLTSIPSGGATNRVHMYTSSNRAHLNSVGHDGSPLCRLSDGDESGEFLQLHVDHMRWHPSVLVPRLHSVDLPATYLFLGKFGFRLCSYEHEPHQITSSCKSGASPPHSGPYYNIPDFDLVSAVLNIKSLVHSISGLQTPPNFQPRLGVPQERSCGLDTIYQRYCPDFELVSFPFVSHSRATSKCRLCPVSAPNTCVFSLNIVLSSSIQAPGLREAFQALEPSQERRTAQIGSRFSVPAIAPANKEFRFPLRQAASALAPTRNRNGVTKPVDHQTLPVEYRTPKVEADADPEREYSGGFDVDVGGTWDATPDLARGPFARCGVLASAYLGGGAEGRMCDVHLVAIGYEVHLIAPSLKLVSINPDGFKSLYFLIAGLSVDTK
ncbi:hypothetical protein B0H11DRAFT_1931295 [Mycena galericulata]|nr:hypothetical protein B0H11DRAFT_1931295 [Mycena galericulata]